MADFTPTWTDWTDPGPFRFWAQKVLPLVYDDSLSYYEVLCKLVAYLNTTIQNVAALGGNVEGLRDAYTQLQQFVNDYFDNLDVQQEINTKLDNMAETGALTTLIQPFIDIQISSDVSRWLDLNIKPTTPAIDASLTVAGAAADAKKVGDELAKVNNAISDTKEDIINLGIAPQITGWTKGVSYANGNINTAGNGAVSDLIPINANTTKYITSSFSQALILFWTSDNVYIGKIAADGTINKVNGDWTKFSGSFDISEYVPENAAYLKISLAPTDGTAVTEENATAWAETNLYSDDRISVLDHDVKKCQTDISAIKTFLGDVDLTNTAPGYFNPDGTIHDVTDTAEVYMVNYFPVIPGETLTVNIVLSGSKAQWARWCFYDDNKNVIDSGTQPQTWTASLTFAIVVPNRAVYLRVSYRTYDALSSFTITKNDALTVSLIEYYNTISERIIRYNGNCIFAAHQGYDPATVGTETGHNKLEGYYRAAEHGFDAGETDIKFTSDNIPVCCHDGSFVDATTGETIVIANSTYAELITHNYYGGRIASFEDVIKACKTMGMQLIIDQVSIIAAEKWPILFNIVKKYGMADKVFWTLFATHTAFYAAVHSAFPKTGYEFLQASGSSITDMITYANSIANDKDNIIVGVNYANATPNEIASYAETCAPGVKMGVWTIPQNIPTCISYLPYVAMITTNRTAYNDLWVSGIENA